MRGIIDKRRKDQSNFVSPSDNIHPHSFRFMHQEMHQNGVIGQAGWYHVATLLPISGRADQYSNCNRSFVFLLVLLTFATFRLVRALCLMDEYPRFTLFVLNHPHEIRLSFSLCFPFWKMRTNLFKWHWQMYGTSELAYIASAVQRRLVLGSVTGGMKFETGLNARLFIFMIFVTVFFFFSVFTKMDIM